VATGADGLARCSWCLGSDEYIAYHDEVWGRPMHGESQLFEFMTLELFQSGLSWLTILRKRESFGAAFDDWDIEKIAAYGAADLDRLLADAGIVRNRAKVRATIVNAGAVGELWAAGSTLDELLWSFAPPPRGAAPAWGELAPTSAESVVMSKGLKKRGFAFVGPTTAYSLMQAAGLVDDHVAGCSFGSVDGA
jgi:DNA-3-methyladenine glycosylase I